MRDLSLISRLKQPFPRYLLDGPCCPKCINKKACLRNHRAQWDKTGVAFSVCEIRFHKQNERETKWSLTDILHVFTLTMDSPQSTSRFDTIGTTVSVRANMKQCWIGRPSIASSAIIFRAIERPARRPSFAVITNLNNNIEYVNEATLYEL